MHCLIIYNLDMFCEIVNGRSTVLKALSKPLQPFTLWSEGGSPSKSP